MTKPLKNEMKALCGPAVHRGQGRHRRYVENKSAAAAEAIGTLEPGCEIFGFTKGQYSIIDIIEHIIEQTGPVKMSISTWTASGAAVDRAFEFFEKGQIESCRFLFDCGFYKRQPQFCDHVMRTLGNQSIRTLRSHAKFVTAINADWNIVVRTSMNLNHNPRLENFEISDDPKLAAFFESFLDEVFELFAPDENWNHMANGGLDLLPEKINEADILAALDF